MRRVSVTAAIAFAGIALFSAHAGPPTRVFHVAVASDRDAPSPGFAVRQGRTAGVEDRAPQVESIRQAELRADLFFLASDAMRGRLTDTPENALTAEWIKARFERLGLGPAGAGRTYFHPFSLMTTTLGASNAFALNAGASAPLTFKAMQDFYPQRFSSSGRVKGPVVFAGYGISAPAQGHDDYRSGTFAGRIVLVLDHEPGEHDPNSALDDLETSEGSGALRKALAAQAKGATAILFVADVHNHPGSDNFDFAARTVWPDPPPRIARYALGSLMEQVRIPAVHISTASASRLVSRSGRTLDELARAADAAGGLGALSIGEPEVEVLTTVTRRVVPSRNVLATIEGSDPALKDEWIVICAHYDHEGADGMRIFNGADDDGSGTVGVLEIAEAYALAAREGRRPRRSVLFAAWNAEELGLLGAWAYADQPLVRRDRIVAVLNMDMIGRNEEVRSAGDPRFLGLSVQTAESNRNAVNIVGATRSADMKAAVERANAGVGLELKFRYDSSESNLMRRSDHWPFLQHGIPAIWFFTGLHPDYHTPDDRPERINYDKMERVVRLVYQTSWDLAQRAERPRFAPRPGRP
jgi:Zn-dependent M28 family amino/carboxypeptidase